MKKIAVSDRLKAFFRENPRMGLAFSGGVDSAYLLYAAKVCGCEVKAYYVKSQFQPIFEQRDAEKLAADLGAELEILKADILSDEQVRVNPENRCYFCKRRLFSEILRRAGEDGFTAVMDGTNATDDYDDRPGMKALSELKVLSPLRRCGVSKAQVREYSKMAGLFTWDKPAYACLATRIPAGNAIEKETLEKIEGAENALFKMNYSDFRVRVYGEAARLQFPEAQIASAVSEREKLIAALKPYFEIVLLDLKGR